MPPSSATKSARRWHRRRWTTRKGSAVHAREAEGMTDGLPVIDVAPLVRRGLEAERAAAARAIEAACRDSGFFYATGHGVPSPLLARLDTLSRRFFALPHDA